MVLLVVLALVAGACAHRSKGADATGATERSGRLPDGAAWTLAVPKGWTGTLLVYSHGLVQPGGPNPARLAPDDASAQALLGAGYALAGTSYKTTGWAVQDALADQTALLDVFAHEVSKPRRTIAFGSSLGGLITTTLLERSPDRFDGGLALCGVIGGTVALWNGFLDPMFVLSTLVPGVAAAGPLVRTATSAAEGAAVRTALTVAAQTPAGQARIALAAAAGGLPALLSTLGVPVKDGDLRGHVVGQALDLAAITLVAYSSRADLEARAGGNPSSNVGVDYGALVRSSPDLPAVQALYAAAGISLDGDLAALAAAPRVAADPGAVDYAKRYAEPTGALADPLLTVDDLGDPLALPGYARAYADKAAAAGHADLLRQAWLQRGSHCAMSPAEITAAVGAVVARVGADGWGTLADPGSLNARARAVGAAANVVTDGSGVRVVPSPPAYVPHDQPPLPRLALAG